MIYHRPDQSFLYFVGLNFQEAHNFYKSVFSGCLEDFNVKELQDRRCPNYEKDLLSTYLCVFSRDGMLVFVLLLNDFPAQICSF
jgi:hypothetical protein